MEVDDLFANPDSMARLQGVLRAYGINHFPALRNQIDDLTNQSLTDLWRYLKRAPELVRDLAPAVGEALSGADWDTVTRVAVTILKRRAADLYRQAAGKWAEQTLPDAASSESSTSHGDVSASRRVLLRQMLQVCMAELARSSPEDRDVLWMVIGLADAPDTVLSNAERQRLSRLRRRLAAAIHRELGDSATALLAADLREE